ncbi:MAG: DUF3822 family protein [Flavobacteriales bacterium]
MKSGGWIAPHYDPARERAWHLSMLVARDVCSWCAHDAATGEAAALRWSPGGAALNADDLPGSPTAATFVTLPEWGALVPDAALAPGAEADHLRLVHGGLPTGAMRTEPFGRLGATCVYVHDDEAERQVLDRFPSARPLPLLTLMASAALARAEQGPMLLLHRSHDRLDAAAADRGRLLLCTTYPARSSQDTLYFALLAAEGAAMLPSTARLRYGGTHLTPHEEGLLKRFFADAEPAATAPSAEVPAHRWLALLEQFACAS